MKLGGVLIAGASASFAMSAAQAAIAAVFERGRASDDRDEEVEAVASVVNAVAALLSRAPSCPRVEHQAVHYLFGVGLAVAYCAVRERRPAIAMGRGAAFGTALWICSDIVLIRAAGLVRRDRRYSLPERANALASHLTYGLVLERLAALMESG